MRILHLDSGSQMRGGQWQVLRLIEGPQAAGAESTLLARERGPLLAAARERGLRAEPLGWLRAAAMARKHDLVHAHDARSHTLGAIVGGAPLVVARRVAFAVGSPWKYGRARHYVAVSEFVKSILISGGVPEDRISVVYDGVPALEREPGQIVLAPAAGGDPQKGTHLASEAARLAGVDLKLSTDLEGDLRRGAIFVYLSHSEGLGSGALLAMSAGAAVIASNVGGLREAIRHGEDGLLVENDVQEIAAALRGLRADPARTRRLGEAARRTVRERFAVDRMVRRTMEVYRQVLT